MLRTRWVRSCTKKWREKTFWFFETVGVDLLDLGLFFGAVKEERNEEGCKLCNVHVISSNLTWTVEAFFLYSTVIGAISGRFSQAICMGPGRGKFENWKSLTFVCLLSSGSAKAERRSLEGKRKEGWEEQGRVGWPPHLEPKKKPPRVPALNEKVCPCVGDEMKDWVRRREERTLLRHGYRCVQ